MVRNQLFRDIEMSNDVVEKEVRCNSHPIIKHRHGFNPLSEVINDHNNVFMATDIDGFTLHKINSPFAKGASSYYEV
jgi:hypothetical protein